MSGGSCLQKADALDVQRLIGRRLCSGWGLVAPYAQEANKIEDAPLRAWETKSVHAHLRPQRRIIPRFVATMSKPEHYCWGAPGHRSQNAN